MPKAVVQEKMSFDVGEEMTKWDFVIINPVLSCLHKAYAPHTCCQSVKIPYLHDIVVEAHNPDVGLLSGEKK